MEPTIPIPITKIKISFDDWLTTPIKYDDNLFLKDILLEISQKTYQWMLEQDDLEPLTNFEQFHKDFLAMMYSKYF
jgi:hypothetical protein